MLILILSLLFTIILHIMTIIISENLLTTHIRCFILEYIRTIVHKQFTEHTILHLRENAHQQSINDNEIDEPPLEPIFSFFLL